MQEHLYGFIVRLKQGLRWNLGNGQDISFWYDSWLDKPLISQVNLSYIICRNVKVCDFIRQGNLNIEKLMECLPPIVVNQILGVPIPLLPSLVDFRVWPFHSSSLVTVKSTYRLFSILDSPIASPLNQSLDYSPKCNELCIKN